MSHKFFFERNIVTKKPELRWKFLDNENNEKVFELAKTFEIPITIAKILFSRGITSSEEAQKFFYSSKDDLHDPFLMKDMDIAVNRVFSALDKKEKIMIYGDYDVDGTNGTALLYLFMQKIGAQVTYYIPDRILEGYGISKTGIDYAKEINVSLIISVDCGITAIEQTNYAHSIGIELIICDHHQPAENLPEAVAILNPMQKDCNYPFKFLCGCGVAFKFISAISTKLSQPIDVTEYLDFVALASTADIVPLIDENRILVKLGLERINNFPRPGIKALIEKAKIKTTSLSSGQVVFNLAPRINAVGRMGDAMRAVKLLISLEMEEAREYAAVLETENSERKLIDGTVLQTAIEEAEKAIVNDKANIFVLYNPSWHPGVIGIVASRIVEKYYRPAILLTSINGAAKGSARSISGFNLYDALNQCSHLLDQFGGHKYAAGLSLQIDKIDELRDSLQQIAKDNLTEEILTPEITIDAQVEINELDAKFMQYLKLLAPFGPKNLKPNFLLKNAPIYGYPKIVGINHLKFKVKKNGAVIDCIGFNLGEFLNQLMMDRQNFEIVFSVDEEDFLGITLPQLKIRDIKFSS